MDIWISLVAGIIIGWVIEWVVDWLYWRNGIEALYRAETELRHELTQVKQDYQNALEKIAELSTRLSDSQQDASAQDTSTQSNTSDAANSPTTPVDDLTRINGIGNTTERKLTAAHITSFDVLSNTSPQTLEEIVGEKTADYVGWIEQARGLARENTQTT